LLVLTLGRKLKAKVSDFTGFCEGVGQPLKLISFLKDSSFLNLRVPNEENIEDTNDGKINKPKKQAKEKSHAFLSI
jgi:hypothetical protein